MTSREQTTLPNIEFTTATGNFDTSRLTIDRVVIHTTVGTLAGAISRFGQKGTQASAHYIVDMDGKLYQGLEEYFTAFHAGNYLMNQRSVGIEHVDNGQYTAPRSDALYETSGKLVADICRFYKIPCDRSHIMKHNEIVATGCPHNLDIDRIIRQANAILNPAPPPSTDYKALYEDMKKRYEEKSILETFLRGEIEKKDNLIKNFKNKLDQIEALASY